MTEILDLEPTYWEMILRRAAATPDRPFVSDDKGGALTFGEFGDRAERVAAGLLAAGIAPRQTVSWQLTTTIDAAVVMAALSRLTAIQNPIIHILRENEVGFIVEQLHSNWLLTPGVVRNFDFAAMAEQIAAHTTAPLSTMVVDGDLPEGDPATLPDYASLRATIAPTDTDWVFYTSGSTGRPKGARHSDWSITSGGNAFISQVCVQPDDLFPMAFPITHVGGITNIVGVLRSGSQVLLLDTFDPVESPKIMAERGATILGSAVPFFNAYLAAQRAHGEEKLFTRLRMCAAGGAPLPTSMHWEMKEELGGIGAMNGWGLTEFPIATFTHIDDDDEVRSTTVGRLAPGVTMRVVGLDGTEQGIGGEGELRIDGPQKLLGYVDESLNADAFDEQGYFRTGDLGFIDADGNVHITGRIKDVIIRNAENISAVEVENALQSHPAIEDVAVIGLPDPRTGERACAIVQLADGHTDLTLASIADHCTGLGLAKQKIPEQLELVDVLPRNPQGKIIKHELRAQILGEQDG